jgi:hypothetical protein
MRIRERPLKGRAKLDFRESHRAKLRNPILKIDIKQFLNYNLVTVSGPYLSLISPLSASSVQRRFKPFSLARVKGGNFGKHQVDRIKSWQKSLMRCLMYLKQEASRCFYLHPRLPAPSLYTCEAICAKLRNFLLLHRLLFLY